METLVDASSLCYKTHVARPTPLWSNVLWFTISGIVSSPAEAEYKYLEYYWRTATMVFVTSTNESVVLYFGIFLPPYPDSVLRFGEFGSSNNPYGRYRSIDHCRDNMCLFACGVCVYLSTIYLSFRVRSFRVSYGTYNYFHTRAIRCTRHTSLRPNSTIIMNDDKKHYIYIRMYT